MCGETRDTQVAKLTCITICMAVAPVENVSTGPMRVANSAGGNQPPAELASYAAGLQN